MHYYHVADRTTHCPAGKKSKAHVWTQTQLKFGFGSISGVLHTFGQARMEALELLGQTDRTKNVPDGLLLMGARPLRGAPLGGSPGSACSLFVSADGANICVIKSLYSYLNINYATQIMGHISKTLKAPELCLREQHMQQPE